MVFRTIVVAVVALAVMLAAFSAFVLSAPGLGGDEAAQGGAPAASGEPGSATASPAATASPVATPAGSASAPQSATPTVVAATPTATLAGGERVYVVEEGDTLWSVAQDHGVTIEELMEANDLEDRNYIWWGQELTIPTPTP